MKCPECGGKGILHEWVKEPCAYCGGTGELPSDFSEMTKLKRCKKCGGKAVFSGVFDDPLTYRFPECIKCGARAEGNSVKDSWYERARKWNEQNTQTNEEWLDRKSTKEKAEWLDKVAENCCQICDEENRELCRGNIAIGCKFENAKKWEMWLKQPHKE